MMGLELLLVSVPLFDKYLSVDAYLFRYQMANQSLMDSSQESSPPLKALDAVGVEAFTGGKPIFVPISLNMLSHLAVECTQPPELTTFLLEDMTGLTRTHMDSMQTIKRKGYSFAISQTAGTLDEEKLMKLVDYVLLMEEPMAHGDRRAMVVRYNRFFKHIKVVATGLASSEAFEKAVKDGFQLFEGMFYRVPASRQDRELTPIKSNLLRLLNLVRDENFEFKDIADVMRRDPALSYMLMRFINSPYLGIKYKVKSIQHAVTLLGQVEVRKWITAAVFKALGSDRPSELTRISLVRAMFAENLAPVFGLQPESPSLFLMGLFSVLDTMLDTTMKEALEKVMVSDDISQALIHQQGRFYPVLRFVVDYERADWQSIVSQGMVTGVYTSQVYTAYLDSISWYNDLINDKVRFSQNNTGFGTARPSMW